MLCVICDNNFQMMSSEAALIVSESVALYFDRTKERMQ